MNEGTPTTHIESLLKGQTLSSRNCYVPTRFHPDGPFELVPHPAENGLRSVEETLRHHAATASITIIPEFWQVEPLIYRSHKKLGVLHAPIGLGNVAGAVEIASQLLPQVIITTDTVALLLSERLAAMAQRYLPKAWHIIAPLGSPVSFESADAEVRHDYHLSPGTSIATNCRASHNVMHPSGAVRLENDPYTGWTRITQDAEVPAVYLGLQIPLRIERAQCHCGASSELVRL